MVWGQVGVAVSNITADTGSDHGLPIAAPVVVQAPLGACPSFPGVTVFTCHVRPRLDATGVGKTQLPQRSHLSSFCSVASFSASFCPPRSWGFGVLRVTYWEFGVHVFRGSLHTRLLAPSSASVPRIHLVVQDFPRIFGSLIYLLSVFQCCYLYLYF